jgi:hypothetical protein
MFRTVYRDAANDNPIAVSTPSPDLSLRTKPTHTQFIPPPPLFSPFVPPLTSRTRNYPTLFNWELENSNSRDIAITSYAALPVHVVRQIKAKLLIEFNSLPLFFPLLSCPLSILGFLSYYFPFTLPSLFSFSSSPKLFTSRLSFPFRFSFLHFHLTLLRSFPSFGFFMLMFSH